MTWDNDYAFIQVFIDYLRQILEMIVSLFNGTLGQDKDEDTDAE